MAEPLDLYIHLPFCQQQCAYCNFVTFTCQDDKMEHYVDYLLQELQIYAGLDRPVDSLYFGRGLRPICLFIC